MTLESLLGRIGHPELQSVAIAISLSVLYAQASHAGSQLAPAHDAVNRFHQQARALA